MNKRMVPLDLVLGILKDEHRTAYDTIQRAFPDERDPRDGDLFVVSRGKETVHVKMMPGAAHQLRDACNVSLRFFDAFQRLSHTFQNNAEYQEANKTLDVLSKELTRGLGLFGP